MTWSRTGFLKLFAGLVWCKSFEEEMTKSGTAAKIRERDVLEKEGAKALGTNAAPSSIL